MYMWWQRRIEAESGCGQIAAVKRRFNSAAEESSMILVLQGFSDGHVVCLFRVVTFTVERGGATSHLIIVVVSCCLTVVRTAPVLYE